MKEELKPVVYTPTHKPQIREGRGFSPEEIRQAGATLCEAKTLKIPIDKRRRTTHLKNVQTLKEHFRIPIPLSEIGGIGTATEEKLARFGIQDAYDLAHSDIDAIAKKGPSSKETLKRWKDDAKKLLKKQQAQRNRLKR
jgi:predicted flap endonuclease-1-like 5' DNA nuclease